MCLDLMSTTSLRVAHLSTADETGGGLGLVTTRTSILHSLVEEKISREKTTIVSLIEISPQREITMAIRATIERLIEPDAADVLPFH
jgi:hypothetical protein